MPDDDFDHTTEPVVPSDSDLAAEPTQAAEQDHPEPPADALDALPEEPALDEPEPVGPAAARPGRGDDPRRRGGAATRRGA